MFGFNTNIMKLTGIKTYLTSPSKCFIPKCKARCCADAPIPVDFLPKYKDKVQRPIYNIINIGHNDPRDTYDSVMFNTTGNPIQFIGFDQNGNRLVGIPKDVMKKMQIKSQEQIQALLEDYQKNKKLLSIYNRLRQMQRLFRTPTNLQEFGTDPAPINRCPEKASRLEIVKFKVNNFIDFYRDVFKVMCISMSRKKHS